MSEYKIDEILQIPEGEITTERKHDLDAAIKGAEVSHSAAVESGNEEEAKRTAALLERMKEIQRKGVSK